MLFNRSVRCNFNREMRENRENLYGLFLLVRVVRVVRGTCFSTGVSVVGEGKKGVSPVGWELFRKPSVSFIPSVGKGSVRCIFNREIRENCESLCSLFLLVRAVRVVRGSCFSTGVSVIDWESEKGSVPNRFLLGFHSEGLKRECP